MSTKQVTASHFVSFSEVGLSKDKVKCIYPIASDNFRRCEHPIRKDDLVKARELEKTISSLGNSDKRKQALKKYVVLLCATNGRHRPKLVDSDILDELVEIWNDQLPNNREGQRDGLEEQQPESSTRRPNYRTIPSTRQENGPSAESLPILRPSPAGHTSSTSTSPRVRVQPRGIRFESYKADPKHSVLSKILESVSGPKSRPSGIIYLFTRNDISGHVKIGFTKSITDRMTRFEKECKFTPQIKHSISDVPHVFRIEQLVHFELSKNWRRLKGCVCPSEHTEWFEIDTEKAKVVMNRWAKWMKEALPYDEDYKLKPKWKKICQDIADKKQKVTSKDLIDVLEKEKREAEEQSRLQSSTTAAQAQSYPSPPPTPIPSDMVPAVQMLLSLSPAQRQRVIDLMSSADCDDQPRNTRAGSAFPTRRVVRRSIAVA